MYYELLINKLSDVIWHSTILFTVFGCIKLFISQYFLVKIQALKRSDIKIVRNDKTFSHSKYHKNEHDAEVINLFRDDTDDFDKAS
jgi:hypothetical protein